MLRAGRHYNQSMQDNYNHYGEDNFSFNILAEFTTLAESISLEQEKIGIGEYNISNSSAGGGDNFTRNPRKEEIRQKRVKQMSGEGNHQYGKPKTQKMLEAVKRANSKEVEVDGVRYNSIAEFSRKTGVKGTTVGYRLNSDNFPQYKYV